MPAIRHLFVLRHAKSSWDDALLDDRDRPLAARGREAVKLLHRYVRANDIRPDVVLCSPARRTRETLDGVAPDGEWLIEPELYEASADRVLARLHQLSNDVASVMVVGHNPAMQLLVLRLAGAGEDDLLEQARRKFPTGALATLMVGCPWSELGPGCADLRAFTRPKALRFG